MAPPPLASSRLAMKAGARTAHRLGTEAEIRAGPSMSRGWPERRRRAWRRLRIRAAPTAMPAETAQAETAPARTRLRGRLRGPILLGLVVTAGFFLTFGLWGSLATLAGGATAKGVISPEGSRKVVQHLEGGRI